MALAIHQIGPCFVGEATGVDLRQPLGLEDAAAIHAGMDQYAVLIFRGPKLTNSQHMAFTISLGAIEHAIGTSLRAAKDNRLSTDFADVSNLDREEQPFAREDRRRLFAIGNRLWHSDSSFKPTPAKYSILHAHAIPTKGGNTEFADMRAAYDALDDDMKDEIEDLVCEHSQLFSRGKIGFDDFSAEERDRFKPVRQVLVREHPVTKRKSLYLSSHAGGIVGWPVPEARIFLQDLTEHATQQMFVHAHEWQVGDLVIWDNRQMMHRARPFPDQQPRDMRRTTLAGDGPTIAQI